MKEQKVCMRDQQKRNKSQIIYRKKKDSSGVVFFNFGNGCVLRLLVALSSMRKVYNGDIVLMLAKDDEWNKKAVKDIEKMRLNIDFQWFDLLKVRRKKKSAIKPHLFSLSPYDKTLMFDGDVLIRKPFDDLFDELDKNGFLITRFVTWTTNKRTMTKRISRMKGLIPEEDLQEALDHKPAINIGILGYKKSVGDKLLKMWEKITEKMAGKFIADEIAIHGACFKYPCSIVSSLYNYSCKLERAPIEDAVIIHYHGNKHARKLMETTKLWWKEAKRLDKKVFEKWIQYDKYALRNRSIFENDL